MRGSNLSKHFVPMDSIDADGFVIRCKKVKDIGNVSKKTIDALIEEIKNKQLKVSDFGLQGDFTKDVKHIPNFQQRMENLLAKTTWNLKNVGNLNGNPVIIDYANILF